MNIESIPVLEDNYAYLLRDKSGKSAVVDPSEADPILRILEERKVKLDFILNTHHHWDHTGGNLGIKKATGCRVIGSSLDAHRIPGIDHSVSDGETFTLGEAQALVMHIPGHTMGHQAFLFSGSNALFCGDTLFTLGCGYLFEGTAEQMWESLDKLRSLPKETLIYCGHEYTLKNAKFAQYIDPDNVALEQYVDRAKKLIMEGKPSVPSTMGEECKVNPFLRVDTPEIQKKVGSTDLVEVFAKLRELKNGFKGL